MDLARITLTASIPREVWDKLSDGELAALSEAAGDLLESVGELAASQFLSPIRGVNVHLSES
jgi:hypothetical protein